MQVEMPIMDTTIRVSLETRDKLISLGRKGESYDTLLKKMIEVYKNHQLVEARSTRAEK